MWFKMLEEGELKLNSEKMLKFNIISQGVELNDLNIAHLLKYNIVFRNTYKFLKVKSTDI